MFLACGTLVGTALRAAERLREMHGLRVGVINARFAKPLDKPTTASRRSRNAASS